MIGFSFLETEFLTRDLAELMRVPNQVAALDAAADRSADSAAIALFSGIILLHDDCPYAAIGYSKEPCSTMVLSMPIVLADVSDKIRRDLYDLLLDRVGQVSVAEGLTRMNFLQDNLSDDDAAFMSLLAERGFDPSTDILQWQLSIARDDPNCPSSTPAQQDTTNCSDFSVRRYDSVKANVDESVRFEAALQAILQCSMDLTSQPRPQAVDIIAKWRTLQTRVFVCHIDGTIAGIISCVETKALNPSIDITTEGQIDSASSELQVCVEYIGVVPEFRCRHVASWLIGQIPKLMQTNGDNAGSSEASVATVLKAFSDAANEPATRLYQRCGFLLASKMRLWCCELRNVQIQNVVSTQT